MNIGNILKRHKTKVVLHIMNWSIVIIKHQQIFILHPKLFNRYHWNFGNLGIARILRVIISLDVEVFIFKFFFEKTLRGFHRDAIFFYESIHLRKVFILPKNLDMLWLLNVPITNAVKYF